MASDTSRAIPLPEPADFPDVKGLGKSHPDSHASHDHSAISVAYEQVSGLRKQFRARGRRAEFCEIWGDYRMDKDGVDRVVCKPRDVEQRSNPCRMFLDIVECGESEDVAY